MTKLMLLLPFLTLMIFKSYALDIKMDPGMREGELSYINCDVGTVTAGVSFFKEPDKNQGTCFIPGTPCSSTLYTLTQNTTGVLLEISSVDASREEGKWYCQHGTSRSSNTISLNNHTISGFLLRQNWTEPSGTVDTFSAVMVLSCTNKVPDFNFTYEDSESNTGTVPPEAVSTTTKSSYDGTTCENENKFYEITLTAGNNLDVFNDKQGVKFSFNYYGNNITAPFSVDFTAFSEPTTESPNTTEPTTTTTTSTAMENNTAITTVTTETTTTTPPIQFPLYAIAIIVVAVLAIIIVIIIYFVRKYKNKEAKETYDEASRPQGVMEINLTNKETGANNQEEGSYTSSKFNTSQMTAADDPVQDNPLPGGRSEVRMGGRSEVRMLRM